MRFCKKIIYKIVKIKFSYNRIATKLVFFIIYFLLILNNNIIAQNLVINPSFEYHSNCPIYSKDISACTGWNTACDSISCIFSDCLEEYFTDCSSIGNRPPNIITAGYQYPRTGNCMVMVHNRYSTLYHYRSVIQGTLKTTLIKGVKYYMGCYVVAGNNSGSYTDNFGFFANQQDWANKHIVLAGSNPLFTISNPLNKIISDTFSWLKIDGYFIARGGEKYILLGSLAGSNANVDLHVVNSNNKNTNPLYSYMYIDDVWLQQAYMDTIVRIGHDTVLCKGQSITLHYGVPSSTSQYWQDNATADSFVVTKPGLYKLTYDSFGYKLIDSIIVHYDSIIPTNLSHALVPCIFPYQVSFAATSNTYLWPDGSIGNNYKVIKPGNYVYAISNGACKGKDSFVVAPSRQIFLSLPKDTTLCEKDTINIQLSLDNNYLWQDGSTNNTKQISKTGIYWVTANNGDCVASDTMYAKFESTVLFHLPTDTILCDGSTWDVNLNNIPYGLNWQDGSQSKHYQISIPGLYTVSVANACGTSKAIINVKDSDCSCSVYAPNAFTPDNNGLNDQFISQSACSPMSFEIQVYNRWGEMIFQSNDISKGWDGNYKGAVCPDGIYYWQITYKMPNTTEQLKYGTVMLMR